MKWNLYILNNPIYKIYIFRCNTKFLVFGKKLFFYTYIFCSLLIPFIVNITCDKSKQTQHKSVFYSRLFWRYLKFKKKTLFFIITLKIYKLQCWIDLSYLEPIKISSKVISCRKVFLILSCKYRYTNEFYYKLTEKV